MIKQTDRSTPQQQTTAHQFWQLLGFQSGSRWSVGCLVVPVHDFESGRNRVPFGILEFIVMLVDAASVFARFHRNLDQYHVAKSCEYNLQLGTGKGENTCIAERAEEGFFRSPFSCSLSRC